MVTKTDVANPFLKNEVVLPPCFLDNDVSIWCVLQVPYAFTTKAPNLSRLVRAHTYIKHKRRRFWCPYILFGSMRVRNN